jgi:N-acetylneuraminic acid mutarotase
MTIARASLGLAAVSNGKLYAIGGVNSADGAIATVEEYDPTTDSWASKAPMPTARSGLGLAAAGNGKLYAIGGFGLGTVQGAIATVEEYDPTTDSWATRAPMPSARSGLGLATAGNGKLYAVGGGRRVGIDTHLDFATVEEYDPATDSWATRAPMPTARSGLGLATAGTGKLYAIGGVSWVLLQHVLIFATVEEYDPATDRWVTKAPMPTARASLGLATVGNGKLYAIGGADLSHVSFATVEEYTP